jgi:uncharacterized protein YggE
MRTRLPHALVIAAALLLPHARAAAQTPPGGTVTGNGTAEVKRQPTVLRVQVEVLVKAKDLKEALARLKERRDAALARLLALGAPKEAVAFGEPSLGSEKTDQQRQYEAMIAQRLRAQGGAKTAPKAKPAPPTVLSTTLRVDLPLKTSGQEELLIRAQDLQEKIKAADLGGLKEFQKLSPQEEEVAEENQAMMRGGEAEPKRGEPAFAFVYKVSEGEYAKALAEAFQKAKRAAGELARAAGTELGELRHLEGQAVAGEEAAGYPAYYGRGNPPRMSLLTSPEAQTREALSPQPGTVTYRVSVAASFALKAPAGK